MADNSYVGIDLGTSYIKGSVLDENGNHVVTVKTRAPAIVSPKPGWTEVDPLEYNFVFKRFLRKLLQKNIHKKSLSWAFIYGTNFYTCGQRMLPAL